MAGIEQMIATVEVYIHHRKNREARIAIPNTPHRLALLTRAYHIAAERLENNNFKQY